MQQTKLDDPLLTSPEPDRLRYALGVMLDDEDFVEEQTYHRGRLARALAAVQGHGTVAGLGVGYVPPAPPAAPEIRVAAGLAIDRFGRLIEIPRAVCINLDRWWGPPVIDASTDDATRRRIQALRLAYKPSLGGLRADVFVRFVPCGREPTPGFATGPIAALDAVVYGRVRDAYEVRLVPRSEDTPAVPVDPWAGITGANTAARLAAIRQRQLARWPDLASPPKPAEVPTELDDPAPGLPDDGAHEPRAQWLLLARTQFQTTAPAGPNSGPRPIAGSPPPAIDNLIRSFVFIPAATPALVP